MLKKFLLIAALFVAISGLIPLNHSQVFAQSSDVGSEEFMFKLGGTGAGHDTGIVHPAIKEENWSSQGINYVIKRAITIMAVTVGSAAVLMMSIGGFLILSSAGDQDRYTKGKSYILKAVIGLTVVLGAYVMVTAVQLLIKGIYN